MLSVICWRWTPRSNYRSTYPPETVNVLRRMVKRHYPHPHRFICVTDSPGGIDAREVEILPDWGDYKTVPPPQGGKNPSCYRRLRLFHPDAAQWFGERFVSLDLDCVITGDLTALWHRTEDAVFWGDTHHTTAYNGSMMLLTAGSRSHVWTRFDPHKSPHEAAAAQCFGSDQGWISYVLGRGEAKWSTADGVYSFRNHIATNMNHLPENARVVMFHGNHDPWAMFIQESCPWVRQHWK